MKNYLLTTCFFLISVTSFSQFKASAYTASYFGLEVNLSQKISGELRFNGTKNENGFRNETLLFYQLYQKNYYKLKLGLGIDYRLFESDGLDGFIFPI